MLLVLPLFILVYEWFALFIYCGIYYVTGWTLIVWSEWFIDCDTDVQQEVNILLFIRYNINVKSFFTNMPFCCVIVHNDE